MKKRYAGLPVIFSFALGAACHGEPEPGPGRRLDPQCDEKYQERAGAVLATFSACESDADCTIAESAAGCLSPFLCSQAIARGNDAAYAEASRQLVDEFIAECGNFCSIADCEGPEQLRALCDTTVGQCAIEVLPFEGASVSEF